MSKQDQNSIKIGIIIGLAFACIMAIFDLVDGLSFRWVRFIINALAFGFAPLLIQKYLLKKGL